MRARWCGGYGVQSVSGYPGAPRGAIWESVGGEKMLGEIGFGGSRTHKTPATSSSSLSNMCARSRSAMLLTTSSVRVELLLGLDPLEPSSPFFRLPNAAVDNLDPFPQMSLDTRPGLPDLDLARILLAVDVWMASSNGQPPSAHNSESIRTAPKLS